VHHHCPEAKIVLVGTKCDLKDDQASLAKLAQSGQSPITQQMGEQMAKDVGAVAYMECSALTQKVRFRRDFVNVG
jgi:GTPase SAR1 family protein